MHPSHTAPRARLFSRALAALLVAALGLAPVPAFAAPEASDGVALPSAEATGSEPGSLRDDLTPALAPDDPAPQFAGWRLTGDGWVFYDRTTHEQVFGWLCDEGQWYFTDLETGVVRVGWLQDSDNDSWYWLDAHTGAMWRGSWLWHDGWYFLRASGVMSTAWEQVDGAWYCFGPSGLMRKGWYQATDGSWYWLHGDTGAMATHEWVNVGGGIYHPFDDDGRWVSAGDIVPAGDAGAMGSLTSRQRALFSACDVTPWPGRNLCAAWVSYVFGNAGLSAPSGNACDIARTLPYTDVNQLKPGMLVAVVSHPRTEAGSKWGHVGIYVGNGKVRDSSAVTLRTVELGCWIGWYGASNPVRYGWANGVVLG